MNKVNCLILHLATVLQHQQHKHACTHSHALHIHKIHAKTHYTDQSIAEAATFAGTHRKRIRVGVESGEVPPKKVSIYYLSLPLSSPLCNL